MNIWMYISLLLAAGLVAEFIIAWRLEKEKEDSVAQLNYVNTELKKEIHDILEDESLVSKSYIELKKEYEELQELRNTVIKPTIYVEKPVIDTLDVMMALPYYDKEDKEEVMEQVKAIMAQRFERDLFDYIDWREDYDPMEDMTKIIARIRVIKPIEKYNDR